MTWVFWVVPVLFGYFAKLSANYILASLQATVMTAIHFYIHYIWAFLLSNEDYYHILCVLTVAGMPPDKGWWNNGREEKLENNNKKSCVSDRWEFVGISPSYSLSLKLCRLHKDFLGNERLKLEFRYSAKTKRFDFISWNMNNILNYVWIYCFVLKMLTFSRLISKLPESIF